MYRSEILLGEATRKSLDSYLLLLGGLQVASHVTLQIQMLMESRKSIMQNGKLVGFKTGPLSNFNNLVLHCTLVNYHLFSVTLQTNLF